MNTSPVVEDLLSVAEESINNAQGPADIPAKSLSRKRQKEVRKRSSHRCSFCSSETAAPGAECILKGKWDWPGPDVSSKKLWSSWEVQGETCSVKARKGNPIKAN